MPTNFIKDNTSPGTVKADLNPIGAQDPTKAVQAFEWNLFRQTFLDIQTVFRNSLWFGGNSSSPAGFSLGVTQHNYGPANWATISTWRLSAADNEGTRFTGFVALNDGDVRLLFNAGNPVDDGVIILQHQNVGSTAANRIFCPNDEDFLIPKGGSVAIQYDLTKAGWIVLAPGGRHRYITTEWLGLYPAALAPTITGTNATWNPTAVKLQNSAFTGLGAAGGSLAWKDNSVWMLQTVDGTGATIRGLAWSTLGSNAEPANQGPIKVLVNIGPGPITLTNNSGAEATGDAINCPGNVDYVMPVGDSVTLINVEGLAWRFLGAATRRDGVFTGKVSVPQLTASAAVTPTNLASGANDNVTVANLATSMVVRVTANSAGSNFNGLDATGVTQGDIKIIENFGGTVNTLPLVIKNEAGSSTAANRFNTPNSADVQLPVGGSAIVIYDSSSRWRLIAIASRADGSLLLSGTLGVTGATALAATTTTTLGATGMATLVQLNLGGSGAPGILTPAALTSAANTDDWNPSGFAAASVIRATTSLGTTAILRGMLAGGVGEVKLIENYGSGSIQINHQDAGDTTAANRFYCSGLANKTILNGGVAIFRYEQLGFWQLISLV